MSTSTSPAKSGQILAVSDSPSAKEKPSLVWLMGLLCFIALLIGLSKQLPGVAGQAMLQHASFESAPEDIKTQLLGILIVPVAAFFVVLVRIGLGLRVLGPFRSILLAIAFQQTGISLGLLFLTLTIVVILWLKKPIRALKLPYFGRVTVVLSITAVMIAVGTIASGWFKIEQLNRLAFFPIVVLSLIGDSFANTVKKEGMGSAIFRGTVTAVVAVGLALFMKLEVVRDSLIHYPEILLTQIAGIIFVCRYCGWRYFEFLNPASISDEEDEEDGNGTKSKSKKTRSPSGSKSDADSDSLDFRVHKQNTPLEPMQSIS